jgi:adenylate cyclase
LTDSPLPSIAVLPFKNLSGEPEQEYFSDGITEDVMTELSKLSGMLVIARNSTFRYKGQVVDVREVGKELGATHVLEGSVRRAGGRVRITAQLQSAGGHSIWAERYDRDIQDVFAVQDEITHHIVAALDVKLVRGEHASLCRRALRTPQALDAYYRGLDYLNRITKEANQQAAASFEEVIRLEPESPLGHLGAAWTQLSAARYGWAESAPAALGQAARLASRSLERDEGCANAHALIGYYHLLGGDHEKAVTAGERSVELAPSHADNAANLGCSYLASGRTADGVAQMRRAMRLSPVYPTWYLQILGFGLWILGRYDEAEPVLNLALQRDPAYSESRLTLAAAHHARGRMEDARREAQEVLRHDPRFQLSAFEGRLGIFRDRELVARLMAVLRELGLQ